MIIFYLNILCASNKKTWHEINNLVKKHQPGSYLGSGVVRTNVGSSRTGSASAGIPGTSAPLTRSETRVVAEAAARSSRGDWTPAWDPRLRPWWGSREPLRLRRQRLPLLRPWQSDCRGATTSRPVWAEEEAGRPCSSRRSPVRPAEPSAGRCWCRGGGGGGSPRSLSTAAAWGRGSSVGWGWAPGGGSPGSGAGTWWGPCLAAGNSRTSFRVRGLPQHTADPAWLVSHLVYR